VNKTFIIVFVSTAVLSRMIMHTPLLSLLAFFPKIQSGPESKMQRERDWDLL
jgi:hypothetical protein